MSSAVLPSRGQCIQVTDGIQYCQCLWFFPPTSPLLDQYICDGCGHGVHTHVDYVSMVVNHHPSNQCATHVQKIPLTQRCTCEAQLCDHIAIDNSYRSAEPWNVLDYFPYSNIPSSNVDGSSNNSMKSPFTSHSTTGGNSMPLTPTPVSSDYIASPAFGPSCDAGDPSLTSTFTSSPSASSTLSDVQPDVTRTQAYRSDNYSDPFFNSYARQSDGEATNVSYKYQDYPNEMYGAIPETWSGPYA